MKPLHILLGLVAGTALAAPAFAEDAVPDLRIGDPAPKLDALEWIKGEPVREFKEGRVYVLDFWATWCGPCVRSIPHINELAKQHADRVDVLGLAIWPSESMTPTEEFVAEKGDEMSYKIAADIDGKTAADYMTATASNGIPTCMVIDQKGRVAWIGHPMAGLDGVVEEVLAGEWDLEAARAQYEEGKADQIRQMELQRKAAPLQQAVTAADQAGDWEAALENAEKLAALDDSFAMWRTVSYRALRHLDRDDEAAKLGEEFLASPYGSHPMALNQFAWSLVAPDSRLSDEDRDAAFAVKLAERAAELTEHKNADVLDTLARAHARAGDYAAAVRTQAQAIEHAVNDDQREYLEGSLAEYEAALEGDDRTAEGGE